MRHLKDRILFILSLTRLGQAAVALITRLRAMHQVSRNKHEASRGDASAEMAGLGLRLTAIAELAAVLALSIGCGSSLSPPPPANKAPTVVNPGSQAGLMGEPADLGQ